MSTRTVTAPLTGFGAAPTQARVVIRELSPRQRFIRAATAFGIGLAAALVALPIPIVHLFFVPGALLGGIVFGFLRLRQRETFSLAEGACPFCGTTQRLGLAGRVYKLPREVHCESCHRPLELGPDTSPSSR